MSSAPSASSVVVLGSLHLDYLTRVPYIPRKGETLKGRDLQVRPGGKGANQAYYAALQGAATRMIGRVGDDAMGTAQIAALSAAGVDVTGIRIDAGAKSGMSVAMIDDESDYGAVIISGANMRMTREDVDDAAETIRKAKCLVLQYEIPLDVVLYAAKTAKAAGTRVVLNAAPAYPSPEIIELTDVLVANEVEAEMLLGIPCGTAEETLAALMKISASAPATKIVTLGSKGLVFSSRDDGGNGGSGKDNGDSGFIPPHRVEVKDAHGAGDCFVGSLAARLAAGDSLRDALLYGNAAAAVSVSHAGPRSNVTQELVRKLLG